MKFSSVSSAANATILLAVVALGVGLGFGLARHGQRDSAPVCDRLAPLGPDAMETEIRDALLAEGTLARASQLVRLMEILDESNVDGAARVFDEKVTSLDKQDVELFLGTWAGFDPEAAMNSVLAWKLPSMRRFGAGIVAREWAESGEPMRAVERLREVKEWKTRDPAYGELINGWVRSGDYEGVTNFLSKLPDSDGRDILLASMAEGIVLTGGLEEIIRWSDSIPVDSANNFKRTAFRKALRQVSNRDPVRAAAWYEQQEEEEYAKPMLAVVAAEWVEVDPEAAIAWLLEQPPGPERVLAMQRLMNRWVNIDRIAATEWMEQADLEGVFAPMIDPYVRGLAATDPERASRWVDRIDDQRRRELLVLAVVTSWRKRDRDQADAWLETLELSDEIRTRIARTKPGLPTDQRLIVKEGTQP